MLTFSSLTSQRAGSVLSTGSHGWNYRSLAQKERCKSSKIQVFLPDI